MYSFVFEIIGNYPDNEVLGESLMCVSGVHLNEGRNVETALIRLQKTNTVKLSKRPTLPLLIKQSASSVMEQNEESLFREEHEDEGSLSGRDGREREFCRANTEQMEGRSCIQWSLLQMS